MKPYRAVISLVGLLVTGSALSLSSNAVADPYTLDWVVPGLVDQNPRVYLGGVSPAENRSVVIAGGFRGTAVFGATTLSHPGFAEDLAAYVAKLDESGRFLWARKATAPYSGAVAPAADSDGNIWLAGEFLESLNFDGSSPITASESNDRRNTKGAFIAKLDPDGNILFAQALPDTDTQPFPGSDLGAFAPRVVEAIATDREGNAYALVYRDQASNPPGSFAHYEIVKLASDGTPSWSVTIWRGGLDYMGRPLDMSVDQDGSVAVAGRFDSLLTIGGTQIEPAESDDVKAFVAKLAPDGSLAWLKQYSWSQSWWGNSPFVAHGPAGDVFVFDTVVRSDSRPTGFVLRRLGSNDGSLRWTVEGSFAAFRGWLRPRDIAIDDDGDVAVVGKFKGTIRAGTQILSTGTRDAFAGFLLHYNESGQIQGSKMLGGAPYTSASAVDWLGADRMVLGGEFEGTLAEDLISISTSEGGRGIWVAAASPRLLPVHDDPYGDGAFDLGTLGDHIHWRCPGTFDAECSGIFDHYTFPRAAEDIWRTTVANASLSRPDEVDQFRFRLPDITDGRWGDDHADIRPDTNPRSPDPEPLKECNTVERLRWRPLSAGPPQDTTQVTTAGQLIVRVTPTTNELSGRPVSLTNEPLKLYKGNRLLDDITVTSRDSAVIACPIEFHELRNLRVTFGERETPRSDGEMGAYKLEIEYRIDAHSDIPDWARDEYRIGFLWRLAGCSGPIQGLPFCGPGPQGVFEIQHPRIPRPDCRADGPGCWELSWFDWANSKRLELQLDLPQGYNVRILDHQGKTIASAVAPSLAEEGGRRERVKLAADLQPGLHFLAVKGPPGRIGVSTRLVDALPSAASRWSLDWTTWLWAGLLAIGLFALGGITARVMLRR